MDAADPNACTKGKGDRRRSAGIGEPISEAQAKELRGLEDCDCKEGMFALAPTRRGNVRRCGTGRRGRDDGDAAAAADAKAPPGAVEYPVRRIRPRSRAA